MARREPGHPRQFLHLLLTGSVIGLLACGQPTTSPSTTAAPSATPPIARLDLVAEGLDRPVDVVAADDGTGRIFVVEQGGRIRVVRDGAVVEAPFLDIAERLTAGGERGLLGLALHPDFPDDPRFFVDYTDLEGGTVISSFELSLDADSADAESERVLMHIDQPFPNHNGGAVAFGPDGMLYVGMGDGGSGGDPQGNGQRLDTHLGKILRIDVDVQAGEGPAYNVPPDNPFVGTAGAFPENWQTGLRNPWRIRFDQPTGDLWIGDVGQGAWEEIDVVRRGQRGLDFGWNIMEGFACYKPATGCDQSGLTLPLAAYGHDLGCAVVGGVVVHDPAQAKLDGRYLFADECSGNIWTMDPTGDGRREPTLVLESTRSISSIGQSEDGAVYAVDLGSGRLFRVVSN